MSSNFMRKRVDVVKEIQKSLKKSLNISDGAPACIRNNTLANSFRILNRIGSGSVNGEAFRLCYPVECSDGKCECKENPTFLAVKKIPLSPEDYDYSKKPWSKQALTSELWAELFIMKLCNVLVENKVTPNLPVYINYFVCDNCHYDNDALQKRYPAGGPCVILINELATGGDIKTWSETPRSNDEWINAYFQIFSAIYALQKYFEVSHHDLHWGNVLVHKIPPGGYWRYTIDGIDYDVPNLGWLFTLWDFGYARIPGKVEIEKWRNLQKWNDDRTEIIDYNYYEDEGQLPRLLVDYNRIANVPLWRDSSSENPVSITKELLAFINNVQIMFERGTPVQAIVSTWKEIYPAMQENLPEVIDHYSFDQKLKMESPLYAFMRTSARQAYHVPTRKQVEAQNRLRQELRYDLNSPGIQQMTKFMRTYRTVKPDIRFDASKYYRVGDIMEMGDNIFIANKDDPQNDDDWDHLGLEEDFDWAAYAEEQKEKERLERERMMMLPPLVADHSGRPSGSLTKMLFGSPTKMFANGEDWGYGDVPAEGDMMDFDPLPPPPPQLNMNSTLTREIDDFLANYGNGP